MHFLIIEQIRENLLLSRYLHGFGVRARIQEFAGYVDKQRFVARVRSYLVCTDQKLFRMNDWPWQTDRFWKPEARDTDRLCEKFQSTRAIWLLENTPTQEKKIPIQKKVPKRVFRKKKLKNTLFQLPNSPQQYISEYLIYLQSWSNR